MILFLCIFFINTVSSEKFSDSNPSEISTLSKIESGSIFSIKFVSPDLIDHMRPSMNLDDTLLKVGPGIVIGIMTPRVLYIRGDLRNDKFLVKNRVTNDYREEIAEHAVDIAFGKDNTNLTLLKKDLDYMFWFDASYTNEDIECIRTFARIFNNLSLTTQFEDEDIMLGDLKNNYNEPSYHYYNIRLVPDQYLDYYKDKVYSSKNEDIIRDKKGKVIGYQSSDYVILWNGLSQKDRNYFITKSLFWSCGLRGESDSHKDSFFYNRANMSATLSSLDKEAIKLLYGGKLDNNMNSKNVRKELAIS